MILYKINGSKQAQQYIFYTKAKHYIKIVKAKKDSYNINHYKVFHD